MGGRCGVISVDFVKNPDDNGHIPSKKARKRRKKYLHITKN